MTSLALFDLDNTLVDREAAFRRWAQRFCQAHGLPEGSVDRLVDLDEDGFRPRTAMFAQARDEFTLAGSVDELLQRYRVEYPMSYEPDAVVLGCLDRLRCAGWKLGVVTNGPASQEVKLQRAGLAEVVDAWCISEVHGAAKPARSIFEAVARTAGCDLAGWMVGDSPEADIAGGRAAGLATIWLSRGRTWPTTEAVPTHICASIPEATALILDGDC